MRTAPYGFAIASCTPPHRRMDRSTNRLKTRLGVEGLSLSQLPARDLALKTIAPPTLPCFAIVTLGKRRVNVWLRRIILYQRRLIVFIFLKRPFFYLLFAGGAFHFFASTIIIIVV